MQLDPARIDECFPFDSYREGQREAIEFAVKAFNDGKQIVVIEAPTGSGKSGIAMTLANLHNRSFYLTVTKILQDQLIEEFGDQMVELRGKGSYPCTFWDRYGQRMVQNKQITKAYLDKVLADRPNCGNGYCKTDAGGSDSISKNKCARCFLAPSSDNPAAKKNGALKVLPPGMRYSACPYYEQVECATESPKVVMNFHAFLYQTQLASRFSDTRDLLVLDEAHQTESIILDYVSLSLDDRWPRRSKGLKMPIFESAMEYAIWFAENDVSGLLGAQYEELQGAIEDEPNHKTRSQLSRDLDDLQQTYKKFSQFMSQMDEDEPIEWVAEPERHEHHNSVVLKPVHVDRFVKPLLFNRAHRVLMLSATILDAQIMCRSLGIKSEQVTSYRMKNRFPVENRPIYYQPAAKVVGGQGSIDGWGPKLVRKVNELATKHKDQRGIVHTHNFAIADLLVEKCDPAVRSRFVYQKDFFDKQEMLEAHAKKPGSIIVAPAMHEGVSLKDDLSRFQILCKCPFPNFYQDKVLKRRMELDDRFYPWLVSLKTVQSIGRSIRSETDWADTYLIDESFKSFCDRNKKMLPGWFLESIQW